MAAAGTMPWDVGMGRENIYTRGNGVSRGECWEKGELLVAQGFSVVLSFFSVGSPVPSLGTPHQVGPLPVPQQGHHHPIPAGFLGKRFPLSTSPHLHCHELLNK